MTTASATAEGARTFLGHPRGLATLFFTEMWERFSYYGGRGILILFMTAAVTTGGLGMTAATAAAIYGLYTASVYLFALPGGWVADRLLGQRSSVFWDAIGSGSNPTPQARQKRASSALRAKHSGQIRLPRSPI